MGRRKSERSAGVSNSKSSLRARLPPPRPPRLTLGASRPRSGGCRPPNPRFCGGVVGRQPPDRRVWVAGVLRWSSGGSGGGSPPRDHLLLPAFWKHGSGQAKGKNLTGKKTQKNGKWPGPWACCRLDPSCLCHLGFFVFSVRNQSRVLVPISFTVGLPSITPSFLFLSFWGREQEMATKWPYHWSPGPNLGAFRTGFRA